MSFSNRPLGRYVHHDPASKLYRYVPKVGTYNPVRHVRYIPVLDQGDLGSCTGNATVGALGTGSFYATVKDLATLDENLAVKIYSMGTSLDNVPGTYPPTDTGSTGLAVAKAAKQLNYISGYQHAFTTDDALAALTEGPIIIGVNWYAGFDNPTSTGDVKVSGAIRGGHEFVLDEIGEGKVGATNSWGTSYGVNGRFFFSMEDLDRLLSEDGDATVFVPNTMPAPVPTPTPTPVDADKTLYDQSHRWAYKFHWMSGPTKVANALKDWYAAKGF